MVRFLNYLGRDTVFLPDGGHRLAPVNCVDYPVPLLLARNLRIAILEQR